MFVVDGTDRSIFLDLDLPLYMCDGHAGTWWSAEGCRGVAGAWVENGGGRSQWIYLIYLECLELKDLVTKELCFISFYISKFTEWYLQ